MLIPYMRERANTHARTQTRTRQICTDTGNNSGTISTARVIRVVKILRMLRIARVLRLVKFATCVPATICAESVMRRNVTRAETRNRAVKPRSAIFKRAKIVRTYAGAVPTAHTRTKVQVC